MSKNKYGTPSIVIDIQPDTVRLIPAGDVTVEPVHKFGPDGVLDMADILKQFMNALKQKHGSLQPFPKKKLAGLKKAIAKALITQSIQMVENVLKSFTANGEPRFDGQNNLVIPLKGNESGIEFDAVVKCKSDGSIDTDALAETFQGVYRRILAQLGDFSGQPEIASMPLSEGQCNTIKQNAPQWVAEMAPELCKIVKVIDGLSFVLVPSDNSWLRKGSAMYVQVTMEGRGSVGQVHEVLVPNAKDTLFNLDDVVTRLSKIAKNALGEHPAIDIFDSYVKQRKLAEWKTRALELLHEDVRAEPDPLSFFQFEAWGGNKVRVKTCYGLYLFELKLNFAGNHFIPVYEVAQKFAEEWDDQLAAKGLLTKQQIWLAHARIAPEMVTAIRDKGSCYPYDPKTIAKVESMQELIKKASVAFGVSQLALAGAVADAYENKKYPELAKQLEGIGRAFSNQILEHYRDIDLIIPELLYMAIARVAASAVANPYLLAALVGLYIVWNLLSNSTKAALMGFFTDLTGQILENRGIKGNLSGAAVHDLENDGHIEVDLHKVADKISLTSSEIDQLIGGVEMIAIKGLKEEQKVEACLRAAEYKTEGGALKANALVIEGLMKDIVSDPSLRQNITKWERLYPYFA